MVSNALLFVAVSVALMSQVSAHIAPWHPSMYGFNQSNFPTNRPQDPLMYATFDQWWFHGHLAYPPHPDDIMQLPVGGDSVIELSCDKGATSWYASAPGGDTRDLQNPDYPCPHAPLAAFHTNGIDDLGGCALSVAYKSDANDVKPEDLVIFSVQHTCVWNLHTHFEIPADMPPCPNGKCICAWHWMHQPDSGSEQMYMNGFQCNFTGAASTKPLAKPTVARRCGAEGDLPARPWNCTYGAKSPLFWLQNERNNMFEGYYSPPLYQDLYNFGNGAQNDIFEDSPVTTPLAPSSIGQSTSSSAPYILNVQATSVNTKPSSSTPPYSPAPSPTSTPSSSPTPLRSSTYSSSPKPSSSSSSTPPRSSTHTTPPEPSSSTSHTPSRSSSPSSSPTLVTHSKPTTSTKPKSVPDGMNTSPIHAPKPSQGYGGSSSHHHKHKHTSGGSCRPRSKYPKRPPPLAMTTMTTTSRSTAPNV